MTDINRQKDILDLIQGLSKRLTAVERVSKYDTESASDQPPIAPNVYVDIDIREEKTHPEFQATVTWDVNSPNTCQADVDSWLVEVRAVTAAGNPVNQKTINGHSIDRKFQKRVENKGQADPHFLVPHLPLPKRWCWQARVQIKDKAHRTGNFSQWAPAPTLTPPWTSPSALPPAPTGVSLTYDRIGKHRTDLYRGIVEWNEMLNFSYAGTMADDEEDVAGYAIRVEISEDSGATWNNKKLTGYRPAKEADIDTQAHWIFRPIHRKYWYRASVRAIDRFHRRGPFSGWQTSQGGDATVPVALTNLVDITGPRRIGMRWQVPLDGNVPDSTVAHVHFQIDKSNTFGSLVDEGYKSPGHGSARYLVPRADIGVTHYMRIRPIDTDGNVGPWQPSGTGEPLVADSDGVPAGTMVHHANSKVVPNGWLLCDGTAYLRTTYADLFAYLVNSLGTSTITIASPAVITKTAHGLVIGDEAYFTTSGALPTGLVANTPYWVKTVPTADTFTLATAEDLLTAVNTSGTQSGGHVLFYAPYAGTFSSTTFNVPDIRNRQLIGAGVNYVLGNDEGLTSASARVQEHNQHRTHAHRQHTHTVPGQDHSHGLHEVSGTSAEIRTDNPNAADQRSDITTTGTGSGARGNHTHTFVAGVHTRLASTAASDGGTGFLGLNSVSAPVSSPSNATDYPGITNDDTGPTTTSGTGSTVTTVDGSAGDATAGRGHGNHPRLAAHVIIKT